MKVLLMHPHRDFDPTYTPPAHAADLIQDLGLDTVITAMARDDRTIAAVVTNALLNGSGNDVETIRFRQAIVRDALAWPAVIRELYAEAGETLEERRRHYWGLMNNHPSATLYESLQLLALFTARLCGLRDLLAAHAAMFQSAGLRNLSALLQRELDDSYLARVDDCLARLKKPHGTLIGARLGAGGESTGHALRWRAHGSANWLKRLVFERPSSPLTIQLHPRDTAGAQIFSEMRDLGLNEAANALARSAEHIQSFLESLRFELAFHVGCINLRDTLADRGVPTAIPDLETAGTPGGFKARALHDIGLALTSRRDVVPNTIDAGGKPLVVITGANQGGKSTFLRSLGLAQIMLQAGLFVAAESFSAPAATGIFTHFGRAEDTTMQHGKLDEELDRIGGIADLIRPGALLLCNESFASTNEREGAEIARQVVCAMCERGIRVVFVTHLSSFAQALHAEHRSDTLFLSPERDADGMRSFRLIESTPCATGYGADLYQEIFGADDPPATARPP